MTNPTPTPDVNALIERLSLHLSWRDSHGELNDAPNEAAQALRTLQARVGELEAGLLKDAARFEHCADMIAGSHAISGTLCAERTIKARHYALEARALTSQEPVT